MLPQLPRSCWPGGESDPAARGLSIEHVFVYAWPMEPSAHDTRPDPARDRRGDSPEDWEQVRRSIAMLSPGAWAMRREQALAALDSLVRCLRRSPPG
jgi:hypothetical protein